MPSLISFVEYMYERIGELHDLIHLKGEILINDILRGAVTYAPASRVARVVALLSEIEAQIVTLREIIREAEKNTITERYSRIEESWNIKGPIIWSFTIQRLASMQPPAYSVLIRDLRSPENILLYYSILAFEDLLLKLCNIYDKFLHYFKTLVTSQTSLIAIVPVRKIRGRVIRLLNRVLRIRRRLRYRYKEVLDLEKSPLLRSFSIAKDDPWKKIPSLVNEVNRRLWKPSWVERLISLTRELFRLRGVLKELEVVITHPLSGRELQAEGTFVRVISWRLYEVYVLYLTLLALKNLGAVYFERYRSSIHVEIHRGGTLWLLWNCPLPGSRFAKVTAYYIFNGPVELKNVEGRPDVGVITYNKPIAIIEAKFSRSLSYLTASRFKLLAYAYEYSPQVAILVYPGTPQSKHYLDDEERETLSLLEKVEKHGGINFTLSNGTRFYIVPVIPSINNEKVVVNTLTHIFYDIIRKDNCVVKG